MKKRTPATTDTTNAYIKKIEMSNAQLMEQLATLTKLKKQDSIDFIKIQQDMNNIQYVYIYVQDSARKLPLTSAVKFMAQNLKDTIKGNISMQIKSSNSIVDTNVCITSKDVYTVNSEFITVDYLNKTNTDLKKQINLELNKDSLNTNIIDKYQSIIKGDSAVTKTLQADNAQLTADLKKMTTKWKVQRFFKDVFEGTAFSRCNFCCA